MGTARFAGVLALAAAVTMGIVPAASADTAGASASSTTATPAEQAAASARAATADQQAAVASSLATADWARLAREASAADPTNEDKAWGADTAAGLVKDAAAYADMATFTLDYVTTAATNAATAETPEDATAFAARAAQFARFIADFAQQAHDCETDAERIVNP